MMIPLPDRVNDDDIAQSLPNASKKKPDLPIAGVRAIELDEGRSLQILHIGSYDDEAPTLRRLHSEYMPANGFGFAGLHHEIYLSDARRVAPEKLKTILRQPVRRL